MKNLNFFPRFVLRKSFRPAYIFFFLFLLSCGVGKIVNKRCKNCTIETNWSSTNILFPPGTNAAQRDATIREIQTEIRNDISSYNANYNFHLRVQFMVETCICDSSLVNINAKVTHGVGESVASTSSSSSRASGNGWAVVSKNMKFQVERFVDSGKVADTRPSGSISIPVKTVDSNYILAVLDSGIDPSLFSSNISQLIWKSSGGVTINNFVTARDINNNLIYNINDINDDHFSKHGSVVMGLALQALQSASSYPKMMVLKVIDSNGIGSTFDLSCALSYANQQNANLINISLGYIGEADSVLHYYTGLNHRNSKMAVPVVAAAGNTEGQHDPTKVCDLGGNGQNFLRPSKLFFPACFDLHNVISVTGLANTGDHCYYQNYSRHFIKLGVINQTTQPCCGFLIGFFPGQIREGTSFVAPVVSGKIMNNIINSGMHVNGNTYLMDLAPVTPSSNSFTIGRNLIFY